MTQAHDFLPWRPSFELGVDELDQQHLRLVNLLNRFAEAASSEHGSSALSDMLDELEDYAASHFEFEEAFWSMHFPADVVDKHEAGHVSFRVEVQEFKQAIGSGDQQEEAIQRTLSFLVRWLVTHILIEDRNLVRSLVGSERGTSTLSGSMLPDATRFAGERELLALINDLYDVQVSSLVRLQRELVEHRSVETALWRQRRYREFTLQLAMSFINLPTVRVNGAIEVALAAMSSFFNADRSYVFRYDLERRTTSNTHEWCAPGILPMIAELQDLPFELNPLFIQQHFGGQPYVVADAEALPDGEAKSMLLAQGIRSLLTTPLMNGDVCLGFVGFDSVRECFDYGEDEREVLDLFAHLLTSIVQRVELADALREKSEALAVAHDRMLRILDGAHAGLYVADMTTHEVLFVNEQGRRALGVDVVGKKCWSSIQGKTDGPCSFCTNSVLVNPDGSPASPVIWEHYNPILERWFQLHDQAIYWDDGRVVRLEFALDITRQKRLEQSLRESEQRYRELFEQSRDALMIVMPSDTRIKAANPAAQLLFGAASLEELLTCSPLDLSPRVQPDGCLSKDRFEQVMKSVMKDGVWFGEWEHQRLDGTEISCSVLLNKTEIGGQTIIQGTVRDISLQKAQQKKLERIAHYDSLTSLPNRALLSDRLQQAMAQANRRGSRLAIVYLDLDGFKAVNDRQGHDAGDRFLVTISNRMRQALRATDTLARLGGDEFVAVLGDLSSQDACLPTLERLLEAARQEVFDHGHVLRVSASLGVTFYPQAEAIDADQLLRQADQAMYQAKLAGRNRSHFFDLMRDQAVRGHHKSLVRLTNAYRDREFVLHYQPKVNMRTGETIGFEALVRWLQADGSLKSPAEFLPLVEGHSLELELGFWVIETALRQMREWQERGLRVSVGVNVSAGMLQSSHFVRTLSRLLADYADVSAQRLQLEILESSALEDLELVTRVIEECCSLGVSFALDDFGTGYSSLTYLKRLPATTLKIDRSFVRDMLIDPDDHAILVGVLGLARAFGRQAVAEGVETVEQGEALLAIGCDLAQGFFIGRPMTAEAVPNWLANWRHPESWGRPHVV